VTATFTVRCLNPSKTPASVRARLSRALNLAAKGLPHSQCGLGAYYRRMAARLGKGKAITATAHKLARLVYAMLTGGRGVRRAIVDAT
jgi:hypothetical protein